MTAPRIAYIVSRFPHPSETFIVRELNAVRARGLDICLGSLFPPTTPFAHRAAEPWMPVNRRPSKAQMLRAVAHWAKQRPLRLVSSLGRVAWAFRGSPSGLARAVVTLAPAAAHARAVERARVEHVHAHYATYPALAAWFVRQLTGVSYSFTAHAHDLFVDQRSLGLVAPSARFVAAVSDYNRRFLAPYRAGDATGVHVVHCGVDPDAYAFRPHEPPRTGSVRIVCVGSLQEYKGHTILLRAIADAEPSLRRVQLDLVGDGPLRTSLERQAVELGIAERVRFLGVREEGEVRHLLERADAFVLPSVVARNGQMEGIPVALMEAMASGVPVIGTRLSGIPELVVDGVTGLLAEPGSVRSLRAALLRLVGEPATTTAERTVAARRLVEEHFDVERESCKLAALVSSAVAESRSDAEPPAVSAPQRAAS